MASTEQNEDWQDSAAKQYLYRLLIDGKLPAKDAIRPKALYEQYCKNRPEFRNFQNYTNLGFATKLMALRERAEERTSRADEDAAALAHDRGIFPKPIEDTKGQPMWKGSNTMAVAFERKINSQMKNTMQCSWFDIKMHYAKRESRIVL
jgi:hypothetical protein